MAEAYLNSTYFYAALSKVMDQQAVLDALGALLTGAGWTDNTGNHYTSPVDPDGRFFHIELTRVSASTMNMLVKDQAGSNIGERRAMFNTAGWNIVQVFYGSHHFCLDYIAATGADFLLAGILDQTPESQVVHNRYVYMAGTRTNTGTVSNNTWIYASMLDNATVQYNSRCNTRAGGGLNAGYQTLGGQYLYWPVEHHVSSASLTLGFAGRRYQTIIVGTELCDCGSLTRLPIDAGKLGSFRGVAGAVPVYATRIAIRVP